MDLMVKLDKSVRSFSRYHKYGIGLQLTQSTWKVICLIRQANNKDTRAQKILELCDQVEELKLLCNMSLEVKAFVSFKQFTVIMEQVMDIARQAEGWRKSSSSFQPESSRGAVKGKLSRSVLSCTRATNPPYSF